MSENFQKSRQERRQSKMNNALASANSKTDFMGMLIKTIFYLSVFSIAFYLFHVQAFSKDYIAEFQNHILLAKYVALDPFGFRIPHPGFHWMVLGISKMSHIRLKYSGIIVLSVFVVIMALMINHTLKSLLKEYYSEKQTLWMGACLLLVSSIYFPPISKNFYLGQGAANFWAVPTLIVVKPFALASILLLVMLLNRTERKGAALCSLGFSLALLFSVIMKPNFILGFLPVAAVYILFKWKQTNREVCFLAITAFAPAILLLSYQYYVNYYSSPSDGVIITWFGVWKLYSDHIALSILLGIAFPLSLVVLRFRALSRSDYLQIAWAFYFVTFLQFAFLAENMYPSAGNFSWGYNIALWILFIFSTAEFFRWLSEEKEANVREKGKMALASVFFFLHLTSGIAYLIKQLAGGTYT